MSISDSAKAKVNFIDVLKVSLFSFIFITLLISSVMTFASGLLFIPYSFYTPAFTSAFLSFGIENVVSAFSYFIILLTIVLTILLVRKNIEKSPDNISITGLIKKYRFYIMVIFPFFLIAY